MREPSRLMPAYGAAHRKRWVALLFLAVMSCGLVWFAIASPKLFACCAVLLAAVGVLGKLETDRSRKKLAALAEARKGQSICEFARDFDTRNVDTWVVRAVFEELQSELRFAHEAFPVRADDNLKSDLLIDEEDLDMDVAQRVGARTGRSLVGAESNPYFGKVRTACDLVQFFNLQAKQPALG